MASFDRPGDIFLADCPARLTMEIIADKWSVVVLVGLHRGARRHGELRDLIGGISNKVLTDTLRRLTTHGLVSRTERRTVPRHVEYALTDLGASLVPHLLALAAWAEAHGDEVLAAWDRAERDLTPPGRAAAPG